MVQPAVPLRLSAHPALTLSRLLAVPIGEHRGMNDGDIPESLVGYSRPFTAAELHELYRDQKAYLRRWHAALDRGVAHGFILPEDVASMKAVAAETANTIFGNGATS